VVGDDSCIQRAPAPAIDLPRVAGLVGTELIEAEQTEPRHFHGIDLLDLAFTGRGAGVGVHIAALDIERSIERYAKREELSGDHEPGDRVTESAPRGAFVRADARHPIVIAADAERIRGVRVSQHAAVGSDGRREVTAARAAALVIRVRAISVDLAFLSAAGLDHSVAA